MGKAKIVGSGGGGIKILNAYIERYKSQNEDIDAGTFVEFVTNTDIQKVASTDISYMSSSQGMIKMVALNNTTAIFAHKWGSSPYYVDIVVVTFNVATNAISVSSNVRDSTYVAGDKIDLVRVDNTRAIIIGTADSTQKAWAKVITVSNNSPVGGTKFYLADNVLDFGTHLSIEPTETPDEFLVLGCYGTKLDNAILKISNTSLSFARAMKTVDLPNAPYNSDKFATYLGNDLYALYYTVNVNSSYRLTFDIVKLTSNNVERLGSVTLSGTQNGFYQTAPIKIDDTHVVVCVSDSGNSNMPHIFVLDITDGVPTLVSTYIHEQAAMYFNTSGYFNPDSRILYVLTSSSVDTILAISIREDFSMSFYASWKNVPYMYSGIEQGGIIPIPDTDYLYVLGTRYNSGYYAACNIVDSSKLERFVTPYTTKVEGVTKSKCTSSKYGKVYLPSVKGV